MMLSYKTRRRLSLLILLVGLPLYIVAAVTILNWLDRPPIWVEVPVYLILGFLWMVPFRFVFIGIGQVDPDTNRLGIAGRCYKSTVAEAGDDHLALRAIEHGGVDDASIRVLSGERENPAWVGRGKERLAICHIRRRGVRTRRIEGRDRHRVFACRWRRGCNRDDLWGCARPTAPG